MSSDKGIKIAETLIGALLASICSICAYYLHSVNQNITEAKELWRLGTYRIEVLERKVDKIENFSCNNVPRK